MWPANKDVEQPEYYPPEVTSSLHVLALFATCKIPTKSNTAVVPSPQPEAEEVGVVPNSPLPTFMIRTLFAAAKRKGLHYFMRAEALISTEATIPNVNERRSPLPFVSSASHSHRHHNGSDEPLSSGNFLRLTQAALDRLWLSSPRGIHRWPCFHRIRSQRNAKSSDFSLNPVLQ
jgi:hypothetical protein